jgi:probable FeS assembly SUF system protein SufT
MTMIHQEFKLERDCPATLIPSGDIHTLEAGTIVTVTQALGGTLTVRTPLGLFHVQPQHVSALGAEAQALFEEEDTASSGFNRAPQEPFSLDHVWEKLTTCFDPEIPVNIVDLGLIYDLTAQETPSGKQAIFVKMTLTAQGCGMGPTIAADAKAKIETLPTVESAQVDIIWDPLWTPHMMSETARKTLGLD